MRKSTIVIAVAAAAVGGGFVAGRIYRQQAKQKQPAAQTAAAPATPSHAPPARPVVSNEVYKAELGSSPTKGGREAKVTIVEFSDFECPFCSRVVPTIAEILKTYADDVQIAFKHRPLPMHPNARPAAQAAEAARAQGKFWEMHDKLFANQRALDRASLEKYAREIGLDAAKFKSALDGEAANSQVEADEQQADRIGVRGTPSFFINGRLFRGAQPIENFKAVIDEEIGKANQKLAAGVPRSNLYAALIKDGLDKLPEPPAPPGQPEAGVAYRVDATGAPAKGSKDALVTIIEFSDFECPFCGRVEPTLDRVMKEYQGKVRIVWRDLPLPFHQNAVPAASAARAAGEQGKFWEMHEKLFANQRALDRASLEKYAQEIGLNLGRFKAALDSGKHKQGIEADAAMGAKVGATGTPAFFINGVHLSGAQPFERFQAVVDAELKKAEALVAKGTPKAKVYETIMQGARSAAAAPTAAGPARPAGPAEDTTVYKIDPGASPARGPKNAPITMVVFSEFQCPYCARVNPTLAQLEKAYAGKIRTVWKNFPLDFHQNARPAAIAAMEAAAQGKFWEMHDKLFANQRALDRASLEKYAQEIGLDMGRFRAALDSNRHLAQIEEDTKLGASVGVSGTPATFINGRKIGGAYPLETFKQIIDQELAKRRHGS